MNTADTKLTNSDMKQGIVEKKTYIVGGTAYFRTKTGKECWFDKAGHLIHKKTADEEEFREYYEDGTIKYLHKINQYEVFYDNRGLRTRRVSQSGKEEFWEYDENEHLHKWFNTDGHQRRYICDKTGKVISWYGNEPLLSWYKETGRKLDKAFAGIF